MENTLNLLTIARLRCCTCKNGLSPPVRVCTNCYYLVCPKCFKSEINCPRCANDTWSLPGLLDNILQTLQNSTIPNKSVRKKKMKCPLKLYEDCLWKGQTTKQIITHTYKRHPNNIFSKTTQLLKLCNFVATNCRTNDLLVLFDVYGELFRLYCQIDYETRVVKWQMFVSREQQQNNTTSFQYKISFKRTNDKFAFTAPCRYLQDNYIHFENFIEVSYNLLEKYCCHDNLMCLVEIISK